MSELFLIAHVAGRGIAVPSAQVDSVVDIGEVTPVPRAAPEIRGLAALRSRVVTVLDTRAALGLPPGAAMTRAIITQLDGHHYALLVDSLEDVATFDRQPLAAGIALEGRWAQIGCGVIVRDEEPVLVIDPNALVPGSTG